MASAADPITRRASTATSVRSIPTPLRHPTPDLQSLQGAYLRNVQKLERSAEEMSQSGSDIGEEIRRLSRQSSIQSSKNGEINVVRPSVLERMSSNRSSRSGSYSRNVVDVNGAARWRGYSNGGYVTSPGPFVTSPVGSASGSWSHPSLSRVISNSKSSRLAQVSEPMQEGKPLDSPLRTSFSAQYDEQELEQELNDDTLHAREASDSSFARRYDEIAGQIEQTLEHIPPSPPKHGTELYRNQALHQVEVGALDTSNFLSRSRSTDTYREAQEAFHDFDGVHFSPDTEEFIEVDQDGNEVRRVSARSISGGLSFKAASILRAPPAQGEAAPPPSDDMVYYPAPVPKVLNLPKRLSQLPAANVQSKRRTQVLSQLPPEARAAGPWLADAELGGADTDRRKSSGIHSRGTGSSESAPRAFLNERMSANIGSVPAHLRAEMFFEHPSIQQNVQIQGESAVATLDSILAASATAPVRAFTDHPFAGDVRKSVYSLEKAERRSTATISAQTTPEKKKKRRSSSIGGILKRTSTDEITTTLNKRSSRVSILGDFSNEGGNKLRKRSSRLSLGDELEREQESAAQTPADEIDEPEFRSGLVASAQNATIHDSAGNRVSFVPTIMSSGYRLDDAEQIEEDFKEGEEQEDVEEDEPLFVQPSTLLAELQVRKAQQKRRNKTAATAFPQGMHSTLLELDAVEEINKRKRKNQRIALAWEDPHQRALEDDLDKGDEDVPLAMLFPAKNGAITRRVGDGKDWERPLGLMEKRELEDNEPLSSRRNRLRGGRPLTPEKNVPEIEQAEEAQGQAEPEDEEEVETLAQRMRRMKTKDALDTAISDIAPKPGSRPVSTFSEDVLGQFGEPNENVADKANLSPNPQATTGSSTTPDPEETLGQRRARLQREREAAAGGGAQRNVSDPAATTARSPMVRSASSLANLLSANPAGMRASAKNHEPASGSLLATNATLEARQKSALMKTNMRSSSWYLEKPLVDSRAQVNGHVNGGGLLAQQSSRAAVGGFASGTYNNGMGGVQLQQQTAPVYATPTAGYGMGGYPTAPYGGMGGMVGYPPMQPQGMMSYQPMQMGYGAQGMGMAGFMGNAFVPQTMGGGTYASYAQNMGALPYGAGGMAMMEADLNPNQRAAIDRWRMGIGS